MLPLLQLYARDAEGLVGPDGEDLLQVFVCPFDGHGRQGTVALHLRWRNSADTSQVLENPPTLEVIGHGNYLPEPCVLQPEQVTEHEFVGLLPDELQERIEEWEDQDENDEGPYYQTDLSIPPGWKLGGFASWHLTDPYPMTCTCGEPMALLLTIDSKEWDGGSRSWCPIEDRDVMRQVGSSTPTKFVVGRGGSLLVFECSKDRTHPHRTMLQ